MYSFIIKVFVEVDSYVLDGYRIREEVEHERRPEVLEVRKEAQSRSDDELKTKSKRIAIIDGVSNFVPDCLREIVHHGLIVNEVSESVCVVDEFVILWRVTTRFVPLDQIDSRQRIHRMLHAFIWVVKKSAQAQPLSDVLNKGCIYRLIEGSAT